jgi:Flp pilus assembly protein TadG
MRRFARQVSADRSGLAAVEFAMILPLMLLALFGTVEITSGLALMRKVNVVARTLSDLTSQSSSATAADFTNFFNAGRSILTPYSALPLTGSITEVRINAKTKQATVQWSWGSDGSTPHAQGQAVALPDGLVPTAPMSQDVYLIWSEVSYLYKPITNFAMTNVTFKDQAYARPRLTSPCVTYNTSSCTTY